MAVLFGTHILYSFLSTAAVRPFKSLNGSDPLSVISVAAKEPEYVKISNDAHILQHSWKMLLAHDFADILQTNNKEISNNPSIVCI